ncbi:MAG: hypothetical protein POH28_11345 [Acidocella sp.]|nr:hypothetical protein [Acidocella sp.]
MKTDYRGPRPTPRYRIGPQIIPIFCVGLLTTVPSAWGAPHTTKNQQTGLVTWQSEEAGFSLSLKQLTPDNVSALYESMGASQGIVKGVAAYCVFETDARNLSHVPITYNVTNWRAVTADGVEHPLQTKIGWQKIWKVLGVNYGLTIFPAAQTFQPGDWGEGFTTVKLPPKTKFDLTYTWSENGQIHKSQLVGLQCASNN